MKPVEATARRDGGAGGVRLRPERRARRRRWGWPARVEALFERQNCDACHEIDGPRSEARGPNLCTAGSLDYVRRIIEHAAAPELLRRALEDAPLRRQARRPSRSTGSPRSCCSSSVASIGGRQGDHHRLRGRGVALVGDARRAAPARWPRGSRWRRSGGGWGRGPRRSAGARAISPRKWLVEVDDLPGAQRRARRCRRRSGAPPGARRVMPR